MPRKKKREPSVAGMVIFSVLAGIIGLKAAAISLALRPVPDVIKMPDNATPGTLYYVKGDTAESPGWQQRVQDILDGKPGTYTFSEGDLNAWARTNLRPTGPEKGSGKMPLVVVSSAPNFRVTPDNRLQVAMPVAVPSILDNQMTYQTHGHVSHGSLSTFSGWIGRCPLPLFNSLVLGYLGDSLQVTDEARALHKALKPAKVTCEDGKVVVELK